jgi:hypothetical protein
MGSKDKGRKESKKPPKPKAKATPNVHAPVRKVENFSQTAVRPVRETTESS